MKKLIPFLIMFIVLGSNVYAKPTIKESLDDGRVRSGYEFIELQMLNQQVDPSSSISWYAYEIGGFSSIDFYGSVSTGNYTTINAQAIFLDGTSVTTAQTITSGTDLTDIKSSSYKFTYNNHKAVTTNVTFNFLIAD